MTASETLIEVMSRFQNAEPEAVLIVWTDADGEVCCRSNCSHTKTIGLAEYAKALALATLLDSPPGPS